MGCEVTIFTAHRRRVTNLCVAKVGIGKSRFPEPKPRNRALTIDLPVNTCLTFTETRVSQGHVRVLTLSFVGFGVSVGPSGSNVWRRGNRMGLARGLYVHNRRESDYLQRPLRMGIIGNQDFQPPVSAQHCPGCYDKVGKDSGIDEDHGDEINYDFIAAFSCVLQAIYESLRVGEV